ncbi:hypothetical protein HNY73_005667 [Argiope bruennichi]|uniref:Uncharacterized protein n=1 Tax=Argiope bruennichi TaxID=94029 RepID=A0A8T0FMN9_ARGBR|nr:hypothetical protein HNY73_005667 [Argiope bruennichi]
MEQVLIKSSRKLKPTELLFLCSWVVTKKHKLQSKNRGNKLQEESVSCDMPRKGWLNKIARKLDLINYMLL